MQSQGKAAHDVIVLYFVELVEERIMSESNRLNVLEYLLQDRAWLLCIPPITAPCGQFRQHQGLVPANEQTGISNFMSVSITTTTSNGGGITILSSAASSSSSPGITNDTNSSCALSLNVSAVDLSALPYNNNSTTSIAPTTPPSSSMQLVLPKSIALPTAALQRRRRQQRREQIQSCSIDDNTTTANTSLVRLNNDGYLEIAGPRSKCWNHYYELMCGDDDNVPTAARKYCQLVTRTTFGTAFIAAVVAWGTGLFLTLKTKRITLLK